MAEEKKDKGSWLALFVVIAIIAIGVGVGIKNITGGGDQSDNTASTEKTEDKYMDAMRKCTVMEASDIYTTGIGKKTDNVFNDARETCEKSYSQWGEKNFYDAVYADWEEQKSGTIEGKTLEYYLDILGW